MPRRTPIAWATLSLLVFALVVWVRAGEVYMRELERVDPARALWRATAPIHQGQVQRALLGAAVFVALLFLLLPRRREAVASDGARTGENESDDPRAHAPRVHPSDAQATTDDRTKVATLIAAATALLLGTPVLVFAAVGRLANPRRLPHLASGFDRDALVRVVLACGGVALVALVALILDRKLRSSLLGRPVALVGAVLVAVGAPFGLRAASALRPPTRVVDQVVREITLEGDWEVVGGHPAQPPEPGVLTPILTSQFDGGDLPSIVMPPPAVVRFTITDADGPVVLRGAAGVDGSFLPRQQGWSACRLGFEIRVGDELAFAAEIDPVYKGSLMSRRWHRIPPEGIELVPGDVVTLRTALLEPELPAAETPVVSAGFGDLVLERRTTRRIRGAAPSTPNVVLILMDTLRADRLSCYGFEREITPHLDALAERGTLFENAYATSSWTWPSTASVLTGLWPETHGVVKDGACYLSGELETLPEVLAARDYVTAGFACNPLIVPNKNFDQGFEHFDAPEVAQFRKTDEVVDRIEGWLGEHVDARFFLYLHLVDSHHPYATTPKAEALVGGVPTEGLDEDALITYHRRLWDKEGRTRDGELGLDAVVPPAHRAGIRRDYDVGVAAADERVGRILRHLTRLGLDKRTVVVFTSDHGEELFDHGLGTHGGTVYEELVRAPLIFAGPGIPEALRVANPVSNQHIAPTLARLAGGSFAALPDALDLLDLGRLEPGPVFLSTEHGWWNGRHRVSIFGLRDERYTLHFAPEGLPWRAGGAAPGQLRLFDQDLDPEQRRDLAQERPEVAEAMLQELLTHLREAEAARPARTLGAGASTIEMLRDIGYIGDD